MSWCIYVLSHPVSGEVRYVGFTSQEPRRRYFEHRANAGRGAATRNYTWWRKCVRETGSEPDMTMIDAGDSGAADGLAREREIIADLRARGARLTNHTDGGEGTTGYRASDETRAKISKAHRGRKQSPEWVERRMMAHRGRKVSEDQKRRMSETIAATGGRVGKRRQITDQEIADIRASITGREGERQALARATGWARPTIDRALNVSLWAIPDDVIGRPIEIQVHDRTAPPVRSNATPIDVVREIRRRYDAGESGTEIARALDLPRSRVYKIAKREVYRHVA